jgi:hypothetical protein
MKKIIMAMMLFNITSLHAMELFIEPGVFLNMMDSSHVEYDNGTSKTSGTMRNRDLSYAVKFGLHFGHYEFGVESEVYKFVAHYEDGTSQDVNLTYNSIFFGYEFTRHQFLYIALSNTPYMTSNNISYKEHGNVFSLEYSNHIRDWVSLNIKVETASELEAQDSSGKAIEFSDLLLVGFSFPLGQE